MSAIEFHVHVHGSDMPAVGLSFREDEGPWKAFDGDQAGLDVPALMDWAIASHDVVTVDFEVWHRAEHSAWRMAPGDPRWRTFLFLCDKVRLQYAVS